MEKCKIHVIGPEDYETMENLLRAKGHSAEKIIEIMKKFKSAQQPTMEVKKELPDGDVCPECGSIEYYRSGTCHTCRSCGWAGGCG